MMLIKRMNQTVLCVLFVHLNIVTVCNDDDQEDESDGIMCVVCTCEYRNGM